MKKTLLFLVASVFPFLLSASRVNDVSNAFTPEYKQAIENRLEKISAERDVGVYVFPYNIGNVSEDSPEFAETLTQEVGTFLLNQGNFKSFNILFFGHPESKSLYMRTVELQQVEDSQDPETLLAKEKFQQASKQVENVLTEKTYKTYTDALVAGISSIEKSYGVSPEHLKFSYELEGWRMILLSAVVIAIWYFVRSLWMALGSSVLLAVLVDLLTLRTVHIKDIFGYPMVTCVIWFVLFLISAAAQARSKRKESKGQA